MEQSGNIPVFNIHRTLFRNIHRNFIENFFRIYQECLMGMFHNYFTNIYLPCGSRGGVRLKVSLSSSQCTLLHPKNILLLPKMVLLFLELYFYFPELPFCFPEVFSFYLLSASFSKDDFFNWLHLLLVLLKSAQRDNIFIALVLVPLGTLYWTTYDVFLITLKPLHGVWFFMYLVQSLGSMKAWKMQFPNI